MSTPDGRPVEWRRFGFLTLPNYSSIALTNAIEACRVANYVGGRELYRWQIFSLDGTPVPASSGLGMTPTFALKTAVDLDAMLVCGGVQIRAATTRTALDALRQLPRRKMALGAVCTGSFALAKAGLLDGYRCAIHWENLSAVREEFPDVLFQNELFVIDRDRLTCSGGTAPLDLMLNLIRRQDGEELALKVSEQLVLERIRGAEDPQRIPLRARLRAHAPALARAIALMEQHIEAPMPIDDIALAVGISQRQLERLFALHLAQKPRDYYLQLRLARARTLLLQTPMSVLEVALACGFETAAHFSTSYRRRFGYPPTRER